MDDKNNGNYFHNKKVIHEKQYHYSIRKLNVGVVSVAVSAFMFIGGSVALADQNVSATDGTEPATTLIAEENVPAEEPTDAQDQAPPETDTTTIIETTPETEELQSNEAQEETESTTDAKNAIISEVTNETPTNSQTVEIETDEDTTTTPQAETPAISKARAADQPTTVAEENIAPQADQPAAQAEDGYEITKPADPGVAVDPVAGRYTFEVVQDKGNGLVYTFSIDAADVDNIDAKKKANIVYVTQFKDGKVIKTDTIDRREAPGTKLTNPNTLINLLDTGAIQISSTDSQSNEFLVLYNSMNALSNQEVSTINIQAPERIGQMTRYVNKLTGEVIHEEYVQTGWGGYNYTTKVIEVEGYRYDSSTPNVTGIVNKNEPRFKGEIRYQTGKTTVNVDGAKVQIRFYRRMEFIDDDQTAISTIYITPLTDGTEETDAEKFFNNLDKYNVYNDKVYTTAPDLTQQAGDGTLFSDIATNDKSGYYLARVYPDEGAPNTFEAYFALEATGTQKADTSQRYVFPYLDEHNLYNQNIMGNKGNFKNALAVSAQVTYFYMPQGEVIVNYVDKDGNVIKTPVTDTTMQDLEDANGTRVTYNTQDKKENTIRTDDGKTYKFTQIQDGSAPESGELQQGTNNVTYVYEEVKGDVVILYRTEDGTPIMGTTSDGKQIGSVSDTETEEHRAWEGAIVDTPASSTGSDYDTTDNHPDTITTADGKIYRRLEKVAGDEKGKIAEGTTRIVYYYELVKGSVKVNYVDTAGNELQPAVDILTDADTGTNYDTLGNERPTILQIGDERYGLVPAGTYQVGTVSGDGNLTQTTTGLGVDAPTGTVAEGTKTITYVYQKLGNYVPFIPENPGDPYDPTDPGTDVPKVPYDNTPNEPNDNPPLPYIPGYTPKDPNGDPLVPVDPDDPTKGYIPPPITDPNDPGKDTPVPYEKNKQGNVVVKYVDEQGNTIANDVIDTPDSDVDTEYDTSDHKEKIIEKDGKRYIFTKVKDGDNETGKVTEGTTTVTYIYKELGSYVPFIPGEPDKDVPKVPYDDTPEEPNDNPPLPYIPGYTPKDPNGDPLVPVDPDDPTKGYIPPPITDPNDPGKDTPVPYEKNKGNVVVKYVDEQGNTIAEDVTDTPDSDIDTEYDTTDNKPRIIEKDGKRYIFTKVKDGDNETGKVTEGTTTVTYIYKELGSYVPFIPSNPGDPYDPTNPGTDEPKVPYDDTPEEPNDNPPLPYIPGYTPKDPNGDPLVPVDPNDPTKGYIPPPITDPNDPGKDTPIPYEKNKQGNVIVKYVDEQGNTIAADVTDTPDSDIDTEYDTTDNKPRIIEKDGKRYIFTKVKDGDNETGKVTEGTTTVTYIYKELGSYVPYIPGEPDKDVPKVPYDDTPEEPNDNPPLPYIPGYTPKDPNDDPLVPVDPDDPTKGYIPPPITDPNDPGKDTPVPYEKNEDPEVKQGNVVIKYVDEQGNEIAEDVEDTPLSDVDTEYDTTDHKPRIIEKDGKRYIFTKIKDGDSETGKVTEGTTTVTYIYKELGNYVPFIPSNPGDPYDPTNPGTDVPKVPYDDTPEEPNDNPPLPYIPGYTPKDPNGDPLVPVDPNDPTKGYIPPPITDPNDPGKDTPVPYEKNEDPDPEVKQGNVIVKYVDEQGNFIAEDVEDTPTSAVDTDYDTTDNKPRIIEKDGKRYIFTKVKDGDSETGKVTEGTTTVTYVYKELGSYVPFIPGEPDKDVPKVPYDDTPEEPNDNPPLPYIPGYTPKDPNGDPLVPVDPNDPTKGYIPPPITDPNDPGKDTPVPYEKNEDPDPEVKQGNVIVKYVDEQGNFIAEDVEDTPLSDIDTVYDTTDNKPNIIEKDGKRYIFTKVKDGDNEAGKVTEGTTTVTYIYKELGSYVPFIPGEPGKDIPKIPYDDTPNEPNDNPPLPYIPGYTPKDPNGDPLVPVDPDDPTKGYIPPPITDPNDPGKDTPVPYEKNDDPDPDVKYGNVVVKYVDEQGNMIAEDVEDTPRISEGTAYDTTDHKPRIIERNGKKYLFVKVNDGDNETGKVTEGTTTVTYIYKELGNYVPYIPGEPGKDIPKIPYDDTPEEPNDNPPLPYVPGYTPKDPNGDPLVPVDPDDPTKGYIPPPITDPNDPGKDTPVPYEKNEDPDPEVKQGNVIVKYVDEQGNFIAEDVEDTPTSDYGTAYDTTDHKPRIIERNGKRYLFTKIKDGDSETGTINNGTTTVTYIYKELGNYVPYIPGEPGKDIPKVPYDGTPNEPNDNPPLPYIPGYTPKDPNGDPLVPVDPNDPTKGYIPPPITDPNDPSKDTPVPYEKDPEPDPQPEPDKPTTPPKADGPTKDEPKPPTDPSDDPSPKAGQISANNTAKPTPTADSKTKALPQTGDKAENGLASLGILSILAGGLGILIGWRRHKRSNK
ncbi:YSIRK-type signal peptide-containing protein [Ligilactobacillus animalis]|nr:YSIRK-type signal peptide-containing protein [Ligilactobacillus animalis]